MKILLTIESEEEGHVHKESHLFKDLPNHDQVQTLLEHAARNIWLAGERATPQPISQL